MTHHEASLTRRTALKSAGGLVVGFYLAPIAHAQPIVGPSSPRNGSSPVFAPNAFIRIGTDDVVTVLIKHIEFGQGPFTGLATLAAEELDADWAQMRAEHAPSNPALYTNLILGMQGTGGSTAIANSYDQMRRAGATARAMLVQAAATVWNVAPSEIVVDRGVLRHSKTKREGRFGQFAEAASGLQVPANAPLKQPASFRLIGREDAVKKLDVPDKTNGKAQFTIDVYEPRMLTVVVARSPRFGGKVRSFEATDARSIPGVVDVKQLPTGIAIYAEGMWPALKGREALRINWDDSAAEKRGSNQLIEEYRELARRPGLTAAAHGDVEVGLSKSEKLIEAEFIFPYLAHAPMEPLDGFLHWDGERARARFGCQLQTGDHKAIASVLGLPLERTEIETIFAGGSFGRRGQADSHLAAELAHAAKAIGPGRPIKLMWTREDDIRGGYYRPLVLHRMRGGLNGGKIVAWSDIVVGQSILKGTPFESMIKNGIDLFSVEGARDIPYDIADFRCGLHTTDTAVPVLSWRSVGHSHSGYAVECFVDELLQAAGKDPVAGRLEMMEKSPRAARTLRAAATMARWAGPNPVEKRARGVAVVEAFGTYVAQIAEVSLGNGATPVVHKVWCAVDCGVAVNPDVIRAQIQGGIGFGLGHALFAEVTVDGGRIVEGNFDTYRSLRINQMPDIEVTIVPSTEKPTGVGEPGVPPIGPAVANAMARLGRERPRRLPIVRRTV